MSTLVTALLLDAIIYPFLISVGATAAGVALAHRLAWRSDLLPLATLPAVAIGMVALLGWPSLPPRGALDKIMLLLPILAAACLWLDRLLNQSPSARVDAAAAPAPEETPSGNRHGDGGSSPVPDRKKRVVGWSTALLFATATTWVAQPALPWRDPLAPLLILLAGLVGLSAGRHCADKATAAAFPFVTALFWYTFGLAGTVFYGASSSMALVAGTTAAALAGMLAVTWPRRQIGSAALLALWPGGMLVGFTAMVWLYTASPRLSLAILPAVFVILPSLDRLPSALRRPAIMPWVQTALSAPLVLIAIAWARFDQGPPIY